MQQRIPSLERERTAFELVGDAFRISLRIWPVLAAAGAFTYLLGVALTPVYRVVYTFSDSRIAQSVVSFFLLRPVLGGLQSVIDAGIVEGLIQKERNGRVRGVEVFREVLRIAPDVYLANARAGLILSAYVLSVVGIPRALDRWPRWLFVTQAVVIDGESIDSATGRCTRLTSGRWWVTLGRVCLLVSPYFGIVFLLVPASALLDSQRLMVWGFRFVGVLWLFAPAAFTLMYFDLKARKSESAVT